MIMASQAYQNDGAIILWWDESEPDGTGNTNDFNHTIPEIVISPDAHPNVGGKPYTNTINYTHSADLQTMEEIFGVGGGTFLRDAAAGPDLRDLFAVGAVVPEPSTWTTMLAGLALAGGAAFRRARG
jgi:hypothetical protein